MLFMGFLSMGHVGTFLDHSMMHSAQKTCAHTLGRPSSWRRILSRQMVQEAAVLSSPLLLAPSPAAAAAASSSSSLEEIFLVLAFFLLLRGDEDGPRASSSSSEEDSTALLGLRAGGLDKGSSSRSSSPENALSCCSTHS